MPPKTTLTGVGLSIVFRFDEEVVCSCPRVVSRAMATTLTWLGHAAYRIETPAGTRLYVDPFLEGNPKCPDGEREPERCDLVVVTHGHDDHVGNAVALAARFSCPVIAQVEVPRLALNTGPLRRHEPVAEQGRHRARRRCARHAHGCEPLLEHLRRRDVRLPRRVVRRRARPDDGPTIYIAGDTNVFGDMALIRRIYAPDVAVLPIGDHFTMGPERPRSRPSSSASRASSHPTTARSRSSAGRRTPCARSSPPGWSCSRPSPARPSICEIPLVRRDRATRAGDRDGRVDRPRRGARARLRRGRRRARVGARERNTGRRAGAATP